MGRARGWPVAAAALALAVTSGCGLIDCRDGNSAQAGPPAAVEESLPPDAYEEATPTPEPTTPAPTPSSKKPKPKATKSTPTEDPNNFTEPECAEHEGKNVSKKSAKAALTAAAGRTYWPGSAPNPGRQLSGLAGEILRRPLLHGQLQPEHEQVQEQHQ
jgi:hypothetical protein